MKDSLLKLLFFINIIQFINTVVNVMHYLTLIHGPNAHIVIAILSIVGLMGYSGVLNAIFLKRKLELGRILFLILAMFVQIVILILSILAFSNIISYFASVAIIHGLVGLISIFNFTAAVLVVHEQQK